jgi:bifunctional enzyme CysN/CysC
VPRDLLRLITAGSVDDGKSTLIGRLLYDSGGVYEDQLEALSRTSTNGLLELASLTDGLRAEREQGITIDVAYRYFSTARRKFIIGDAPGHEQYTRNMATGASTSQVALVLMDARKGVLSQTIRHTFIASLLGIKHIVVAVNKMDLMGFQEETFKAICMQFQPLQSRLDEILFYFVPTVAADGDNVVRRSERMQWFEGPSILEYLENVPVGERTAGKRPFRMAVQYVLRGDDYRGYAGQIASGSVVPGDELLVLPSRKRVRVTRLPAFRKDLSEAFAPMSVSLCLSEHVDVGRGDMLADATYPPEPVRSFQAKVVWMSEMPLLAGRRFLLKHTSQSVCSEIRSVASRLDLADLNDQPAEELRLNDIGTVIVQTHRPIFCDAYGSNRNTGSFIFIDPVTNLTVGAGMIETVFDDQAFGPQLEVVNGATVWFTGLSSSGKTTLSLAVYERLWARGYRVELLDGDEVRLRLSRGLGFSKDDRNENVRRIGFVAEVLARQGVIALVSAISPYRDARDEVRSRISNFLEVYVNAPLDVCEERDVKGLYRKARSGEIAQFTGINDPYEPPLRPDVECRTDLETAADCADKIVAAVEARVMRHATREAI